ncbi:hypothetical protein ASPWEDRAFT_24587 [Aspergillus wentii DTO 134E9]|uniref:Uncharacterized protein n=1 Tax=Aspergillus wentii DTO 134E9 TaxID=1073089 RepID=A0A1L9RUS9_ASPWE|nr:uncharacterized protein ASPWEDRAFT_24587 [Aspergillus wentii DTO 134E9]OJJ38676.1 hypothetical protein ASPWEDRAFT_24587 [Aspergillus wentii DTO 134E9]
MGGRRLFHDVTSKPIKSRKGVASSKEHKEEKPGRAEDPSTFLSIESNEQKIGAYLGYDDASELRKLAVSWPVLKAYGKYEAISKGLSRRLAFRLIQGNEEMFTKVNADEKWPLAQSTEPKKDSARHLAALLLTLEDDLKIYRSDPKVNGNKTKKYRDSFKASYPDLPLPAKSPKAIPPNLGPLLELGESRLESINRCWSILKYMKYTKQLGSWEARFANGVHQGVSIDASHIPGWMQPQATETPAIEPPPDVAAADRLQPIELKICWKRSSAFPGSEELSEVLEKAEDKGIFIPSGSVIFQNDPRLFYSIFSFKDEVRRMYNCQEIGMDVRNLRLSYHSKSTGEKMEANMLIDPWNQTKDAFINPDHCDFSINVVFESLDDPDSTIYESSDPPPAVRSFLNTKNTDVTLNIEAISARASHAIPTSPEQTGAASLKEYLDGNGAKLPNEIGAPPEPKAFDKREESLRYYSGYDVQSEEGKRGFQRMILAECSRNAQAARLKLDKLPKDLDQEQQIAITAAQATMRKEAIDGEGCLDNVR